VTDDVKGPSTSRRPYDSPLRREQARQTERRILDAAEALFTERGYVGTSLAAVAERAGLNPRTVYKVVGTKVALLDRLVGVAMAGDQDAIAVMDRDWATAAFGAPTGEERVRAFAAALRRLMASAGHVLRVAAQAAAADPEAATLWATGQRLRRDDAAAFVSALRSDAHLRPDLDDEAAVGTVWLLASPETHLQLVDGLGWSIDAYEGWVAAALAATLLP
jgi:AcrR family transcriptional regulator